MAKFCKFCIMRAMNLCWSVMIVAKIDNVSMLLSFGKFNTGLPLPTRCLGFLTCLCFLTRGLMSGLFCCVFCGGASSSEEDESDADVDGEDEDDDDDVGMCGGV